MINTVLAIVAVAIAAVYGFGIMQIPPMMFSNAPGPSAFPTLLMILLLGIAALLLLEGVRAADWQRSKLSFGRFLQEDGLTFAISASAILLYFLLFEPLGFLLSTLIFLLGSMLILFRGAQWIPVLVAFGFCGLSFYIFVDLFGTQLPRGILPI